MQPDSAKAAPYGLREKLETVTGVRALIVTLLLGSAVVLNVDSLESLADPSYLAIGGLIAATYVATVLYSVVIRHTAVLGRVAYAQFVGDGVLSGGLVLLTGGVDSAFLFLFFLNIITASFLVGRAGALFSASVSSVAYALVALTQRGHLPAVGSLGIVFGGSDDGASYTAAVHIASFYAVALLAGHLAERLGQVGSELEMQRTDVQALRALNENIVNSVAGGLCTLDLDDRVIAFNRSAERITGMKARRILGRHCQSVLPQFAHELAKRPQRPSSYDAPPVNQSVEFDRLDGQRRFLDLSIAPLHDAAGHQDGHILYFSDVTEVRRLQEVIQRQKRMAAIGQLSASIAHEIRNPLASISGSIEVLRDAARRGESDDRLMDIVVREIDRLNDLVSDFLSYARPREIVPQRVEIRQLLEDCVLLAKQDSELSDGISFDVGEPSDEPLWIEADPDQLRQVLWNLTRNAAEAMKGRGRIRFRVKPASVGGAGVAISISDTGPGLTPEARRRLFEPFFTTKSGGTGLGLATAHRAVEAHGGLIWADQSEGATGTRFWVVIPSRKKPRATQSGVQLAMATAERLTAELEAIVGLDTKPVESR